MSGPLVEDIIMNGRPMRQQADAMVNSRSGVKLTAEDHAIFRRFSWLSFARRPNDEMCDIGRHIERVNAYIATLNT